MLQISCILENAQFFPLLLAKRSRDPHCDFFAINRMIQLTLEVSYYLQNICRNIMEESAGRV